MENRRECQLSADSGENLVLLHHPWKIHRLAGDGSVSLSTWSHVDSCDSMGMLAVVGNQIIVPSRGSKLLVIYSMEGTKTREINCPELTNGDVAICDAGEKSIAVSTTNQVIRVDLETGSVLWRNNEMGKPGGVTCYDDAVILVGLPNCVWILDNETGK